jgi:riboflavin kinase
MNSYIGPVAAGYGRGSKKLGFPTANLPYFDGEIVSHELSTGVYGGYCTVGYQDGTDKTINSSQIYKCVTNIGLSPTFVGKVSDKYSVHEYTMYIRCIIALNLSIYIDIITYVLYL